MTDGPIRDGPTLLSWLPGPAGRHVADGLNLRRGRDSCTISDGAIASELSDSSWQLVCVLDTPVKHPYLSHLTPNPLALHWYNLITRSRDRGKKEELESKGVEVAMGRTGDFSVDLRRWGCFPDASVLPYREDVSQDDAEE
ncbi:hypothetical protein BKA70DRAFT_1419262 [Coprinopsis sp. MPI-PUGE-AT-0042]|nr:hypothetical protein BKA70DRAFT_1419262 [Coprinopsis sp. MPI-PUGE-AT-0042]